MLLVINSLGADIYMHLWDHIRTKAILGNQVPGLIIMIESQFFFIKRFLSDRITIVVPKGGGIGGGRGLYHFFRFVN